MILLTRDERSRKAEMSVLPLGHDVPLAQTRTLLTVKSQLYTITASHLKSIFLFT